MMKWNKPCHLDERQLLIRGNIFQHGWMLSIALLVINMAFTDIVGHGIFINSWDSLFILALIVSITTIEMICYEIYPLSKSIHKKLYIVLGIFGFGFIGVGINYLIIVKEPIIVSGMINTAPAMISVGTCYLAVYITFVIKELFFKEEE